MCGRYTLKANSAEVARELGLVEIPAFPPRYNIAPTQPVVVVRQRDGRRRGDLMRWGLIPSWAKDPAIGSKLINARRETLAEKPSFRTAFRRRRCLVPATGFYEWQQDKTKQPYHFTLPSGRLFAFAGLWDDWLGADGSEVETVTIVTMDANAGMAPYHHRMPVVVSPAQYDLWLDPKVQEPGRLEPVFAAAAGLVVTASPVGKLVNDVRREGPELLAPPAAPAEPTQLSWLDG